MSEESPDTQLSFDDERDNRRQELLESTDRMLDMVQKSRDERAAQTMPGSRPLDIPPSVQIHLDARKTAEQAWDNAYETQAKKWPGPAPEVRSSVEKQGIKRPIDGEDIDEAEQAKAASARAELVARKSSSAAQASSLHEPASRTRRLRNPTRPGRGGDKNAPEHITEIDGERIIR